MLENVLQLKKEGLNCTDVASSAFPRQYRAEGKLILELIKADLLAETQFVIAGSLGIVGDNPQWIIWPESG